MASRRPTKKAPSKPKPRSSRDKVRAHRAKLRAQGLRPIQFWVPDVNSPEFAAEAHRQSMLAAQSPRAEEDMAFLESLGLSDEE